MPIVGVSIQFDPPNPSVQPLGRTRPATAPACHMPCSAQTGERELRRRGPHLRGSSCRRALANSRGRNQPESARVPATSLTGRGLWQTNRLRSATRQCERVETRVRCGGMPRRIGAMCFRRRAAAVSRIELSLALLRNVFRERVRKGERTPHQRWRPAKMARGFCNRL